MSCTKAMWSTGVEVIIVIMNFEPELCLSYRFYCISVLIKFIAVVFELGIFSGINLLRISSQDLNSTSCTFKDFDTNFAPIISPANIETQIFLL